MGRSKDIRMLVVHGFARLVAHGHNMELQPDILARSETSRCDPEPTSTFEP